MRTASTTTLVRSTARAQQLTWLLELTDGSWLWRGATLATALGEADYPARLGGVESWRESVADITASGGVTRGTARITVVESAEDPLRTSLENRAPVGLHATLRVAWPGETSLADGDAVLMLRGRVVAWRQHAGRIELELADELQVAGSRPLTRLLHPALAGGWIGPALGRTMPWIFGAMAGVPLVPVNTGRITRLAAAVDDAAGVIPVLDVTEWPVPGVVQIDGEQLTYEAIDTAAGTLGSMAHPVVRDAPVDHARGATVRLVPAGGFRWLVADHPCRSVAHVKADGQPLDPGDTTFEQRLIGGRTATLMVMDAWPLDAEGRPAHNLTADVEGVENAAGELVDRPTRLLRFLLEDARAMGFSTADIDTDSFAVANDALEARGYRIARRLTTTAQVRELIEDAAREAGLWLTCGPPFGVIPVQPTPLAAEAQSEIGASLRLGPADAAEIEPPRPALPPKAIELTGRTRGGETRSLEHPAAEAATGAIPERRTLDWLAMDSDGPADLADLLWTRLRQPMFRRTPRVPPGGLLLRPGETVTIDGPATGDPAMAGWVAAVTVHDTCATTLEIAGPWAGGFCWQADDANHWRRIAFGEYLLMTLGGKPVARLERGGRLALAGRLRESAEIAAGPFEEAVAMEGGTLYLCTGAGSSFSPFLAIDASGNVTLTGRLREHSGHAFTTPTGCHGANEARLWIAPDLATTALEYEAATGVLHLRGALTESARL